MVEFPGSQSLNVLVHDAFAEAMASDSIKEKIRKAMVKAVDDSIESATGYGSPFRKMLQAKVAEVLPTVDVDDLAVFSNAVREVIQRRLANLASDTAAKHLESVLEMLLPAAPEITIDELRNAYLKKVRDQREQDSGRFHSDDEPDDENEPDITWNIEVSKSAQEGYWDLWMAPKPNESRYGGKDVVTLRFKEFKNTDALAGLHECWHASVGSSDRLVGSLFAGPLYGFDAMVFRLATGTAKLRK